MIDLPTFSLEERLLAESPRLTPRIVPLISQLITVSTFILYFLLLWPAFFRQNLAAWSIGIAYILYDTALLVFTQLRKSRG